MKNVFLSCAGVVIALCSSGAFAQSQYRVPRFRDMPHIATVLLDRKDLTSAGAGETPIIGIAPAIRNAILAATGVALRALPLVPHGLPSPERAG